MTVNAPEAAVAILRAREPYDSVLLIRRAVRAADPWSGHWSLPGGHCEPGDADPLATALRELAEECSIDVDRAQLCATLTPAPAGRAAPAWLMVAPFVFELPCQIPATVDPAEAERACWLPVSTLTTPENHTVRHAPSQPARFAFPSVALDGPPLWGFTYRVLTQWLHLLPAQPAEATRAYVRQLLDCLRAEGLVVRNEDPAQPGIFTGAIPVDRVFAWLARPRPAVPPLARVEVSPQAIHLFGLAGDEHQIIAVPE